VKNIRRFAGTISTAACIAAFLARAGALGQSAEDGFGCDADGPVHAIAVQADGKILVGGAFTNVGGMVRSNIARLHVDGRVDTSFNPGMDPTFIGVIHLIVQPDGKILVGGNFRMLGGQAVTNLGRLNVDGSVDASFHPPGGLGGNALALQADGKILVGGKFALAGRQGLVRLNADGSLDDLSVFGNNSVVDSLAVQPDGKILVGGSFTLMAGQTRLNLGRLLPDGTLDSVFNPGAHGQVQSLAVQPDGRILVGGMFTMLGGQPRAKIGRLLRQWHAGQYIQCGRRRHGQHLLSAGAEPDRAGGWEDSGGRHFH
jgi:uncharacterized delta-60 repeat protein